MRKMMKYSKKLLFLLLVIFATNVLYGSPPNQEEKLKAFQSSITEESIGNYDKAIELIKPIYDQEPNDYLANIRLGWLYYLSKKNDLATKHYKEAVRISGNSIESLLGLTYPYSAIDNWEEIKNIYKQIIDIDPLNYTANLNIGKIYYNSADYLNAKKIFEKLADIYPSDYETNLYLGWTYYSLGSNSKAYDYFVMALIANPSAASAKEGLNLTR